MVSRNPRSLLSLRVHFRGFTKSANMEEQTKIGTLTISHVFSEFGISYFHSVDLASTTPNSRIIVAPTLRLACAWLMRCIAHMPTETPQPSFSTARQCKATQCHIQTAPFPTFVPNFSPDSSMLLLSTPGRLQEMLWAVPQFYGPKYIHVPSSV